jgi:hypothetical protein
VRSLFPLGKASWWGGHYWNWASAQLPPCVGPYFGNALTLVLYLTLNALDQWWKCWLWEESLAATSTKKECFDWCLIVMSFLLLDMKMSWKGMYMSWKGMYHVPRVLVYYAPKVFSTGKQKIGYFFLVFGINKSNC